MSAATVTRAEAGGAETRPLRILRALAGSPVPLSTPELVTLLDEGIPLHHWALSRYGQVLRAHEDAGRVTRGGRTAGSWQKPPADTWSATEAGRAWLAGCDEARERAAVTPPEATALAEEIRRSAAARDALLERARALYGPETPRAVRAEAARALADYGYSMAEVAVIFGVTRQAIQQDLSRHGAGGGAA